MALDTLTCWLCCNKTTSFLLLARLAVAPQNNTHDQPNNTALGSYSATFIFDLVTI
eukprot:m.378112 g.378112  ORF g.378112 m.378112 type:complete len:56 (-) comp91568_c0_seq1:37-204(-)